MPAIRRSLHAKAKLLCWHLLLLLFSFITACVSLLSYLKFLISSSSSRRPKKLPRHLALLLDSEDVGPHLSKVVLLLQQLAHLGIQHVSLYDAKGTLKLILADALKGNTIVRISCHSSTDGGSQNQRVDATHKEPCSKKKGAGGKNNSESVFPCENKGLLMVEILCIRDGKQAIVEAARNICLKSLQSGAFSDLREEDIETSLKETGGFGPDPDLLMLFSNSRCLQGFPPWRLRLTEILHVGSIKDMSEMTIYRALDEFCYKHHRYGK